MGFDIGCNQVATVIRMRKKVDVAEMWSDIKKPRSTLWCDCLIDRNGRKSLISDDEDESDDNMPSWKQNKIRKKFKKLLIALK